MEKAMYLPGVKYEVRLKGVKYGQFPFKRLQPHPLDAKNPG